jgi:two-component system, NarL family, nitrate/nitrite sensor histidine kinase NarX
MREQTPILRILVAGRLLGPLGFLVVSLMGGFLLSLLLMMGVGGSSHLAPLFLFVGLLGTLAGVMGAQRLYAQLLRPLVRLEQSVADVCQGQPGVTMPLRNAGVLGTVMRDLDSLSDELTEVYEDMDNRVARQTRRLAQQTAALKLLYDVAAGINQAARVDDLLMHFLEVLKQLLNGRSASVYLTTPEGRSRLMGSIGPDSQVLAGVEQLPLPLCECGKALSAGDILCERDAVRCSRNLGRRMFGPGEVTMLEVPLRHHGVWLGSYRIYLDPPGPAGREDLRGLLDAIGSHLGMAVAKQRSDDEARRLSIMEERTAMAHELHDSLAQTLASLRFQVRMLEETLEKTQAPAHARADLHRIRNGVDEAHTELRELLNSFLVPIDQRGLEPALEKLTQRFRQDTGTPIFFQRDCRNIHLTASEELQIFRIVQEALVNIRKHAQAQTVRVLLTCREAGGYLLLVEDDGVGFEQTLPKGKPGEHIGLSIMEERARRLGGELRIESEPGEGTRVELIYNPASRQNAERRETH